VILGVCTPELTNILTRLDAVLRIAENIELFQARSAAGGSA
jgi:hypothetical protein